MSAGCAARVLLAFLTIALLFAEIMLLYSPSRYVFLAAAGLLVCLVATLDRELSGS